MARRTGKHGSRCPNGLGRQRLAVVSLRADLTVKAAYAGYGCVSRAGYQSMVIGKIKKRMVALNFDLEKHTLVFDRGNNSQKNLALVAELKLHYLGALVPYQHQTLLEEAQGHYQAVVVKGRPLDVYRSKKTIRGQATVEEAFKNIKNPHHLALKPQFQWTDHEIIVHNFICVVGYLLSTLLCKEARRKAGFTGTLDSLLEVLNKIRLATLIEQPKGRGRPKAIYKLEDMSEEELALINALDVAELHQQRPKLKGVGVYN